MSSPHLSIVIPAYNEEERLAESLPKILGFLESQPFSSEVLLVDDGSHDQTSAVAEGILASFPHTILRNEPNAGKGASIRRGMLASEGSYALFTDADLSTPIEDVERLIASMDAGADVAIGSRALPESDLVVRQPWYRETMGRTFNLMVRALLLPGIHDTQCGFKLFSRRAVDLIFPHQTLDGFAFDVELLALAREMGLTIQEVGVHWENSPASRVNALRDSAKMFRDLFRVRALMRQHRRSGTLATAANLEDRSH